MPAQALKTLAETKASPLTQAFMLYFVWYCVWYSDIIIDDLL